MATPITGELEAALVLARQAGEAVLRHYGSTESETKAGGSPVTAADLATNDVIRMGLRERFPDDAILSEKSRDDASRLEARRVWIVDPLDGTKEFLARNGEFSIMIGLVVDGRPVLGVVYLPDGDLMYRAAAGSGAWVRRDGATERLARRGCGPGGAAASGVPQPCRPVARPDPGRAGDHRRGAVRIRGREVHPDRRGTPGPLRPPGPPPDTCAPEVILGEAGGRVSDSLGGPLRYNKPDPAQPRGILARAPGCEDAMERVRPIFKGGLGEVTGGVSRWSEPRT